MDNIDLEAVTIYAGLHYSIQQICTMMGIDQDQAEAAMHDRGSAIYRAYWKGYYESDVKLRSSIFKLAFSGSSPAQALAKRIQEQNETRQFYEQ